MKIDTKLLEKLELLSYLKIDENKKQEVISQLSDILEYMENLNELDTSSVDSYFSNLSGGTPLREDIPYCDCEINKQVIKNAPNAQDNFFIVPAIID